jgi:hypothetical protein
MIPAGGLNGHAGSGKAAEKVTAERSKGGRPGHGTRGCGKVLGMGAPGAPAAAIAAAAAVSHPAVPASAAAA